MGDDPNDEPRPGEKAEREESPDSHSGPSDQDSEPADSPAPDDGPEEPDDVPAESPETGADDTPDDSAGTADAADDDTAGGAVDTGHEADAEETAADESEQDEGTDDDGSEQDDETAADESEQDEGTEDDDSEQVDETAADESEQDEETDDDGSEQVDPDASALERKTGPQSDEEQPLAVHIEEMVKRLGVVIAIAGAVSLAAFPFAEGAITFLWYSILPSDISQPHVYHPLELVLTQLKTASLLGLVIALPAFVYETYAFMRPGLYPHERRYYLAAVPTSLILALVGITFAYFIVLPAVMNYFLYYSDTVVDIAFALGQTFNLFLILMGYLAIVFQIPLFIMLAIMMGLTTREWMEDRRLIFWGVFLGLSFLFSPDPTGMAPLIVAATMVGLFEGTLLLLRWTQRG
ncbi:MAG: twin-arginine translocase subunit TatC [archaeon]